MARISISSTYEDLKDHREAVYVALRRLGHESAAMEEWAATEQSQFERRLAYVRSSDVVVFLIAWRYGYVPADQQYSVTELEYQLARQAGIPCVIFITEEDAPWPAKYFDYESSNIKRFRREVLKNNIVAFFTTPGSLATQVALSLHRWVASGARELLPTPEAVSAAEAPGPEVFLSYAHEDVELARSVSERIGREKWSVFWDRTSIPVGVTWDDIVESALEAAKCVVVLWSPAASNSEWVRNEATEAADRRILTPAVIKETKIPLRFRRIQAADLVGWSPHGPDTPGMQALISAIKRLCSR